MTNGRRREPREPRERKEFPLDSHTTSHHHHRRVMAVINLQQGVVRRVACVWRVEDVGMKRTNQRTRKDGGRR